MTEDKLQQNCFLYFWNRYPLLRGLLFAVPNGGRRDVREAVKFKSTGLVAGIPDMIFLYYGKAYFFELKTATGRLSSAQKKIHLKLLEHGFVVQVIRSEEQFKTAINTIMKEA